MSGDSKIGIVGGVVRTAPVRKLAESTAATARSAAPRPAAGA